MEWPDEVIRDVDNFLSEETVGKIMDENIVEVPEEATVGEVREEVRSGQIVASSNKYGEGTGQSILLGGRLSLLMKRQGRRGVA